MTLDAFETNGSSPPELSELEVAVQKSVEVYVAHRKVNAQYAVEAGRLLLQLKEEVGEHGTWLPTLERLDIEVRVAQRCMRLARKYVGATHLPTTVTEAEAAVATPIPDYHNRHWLENWKKVLAVDPELADRVGNEGFPLREAMALTKAARIRRGREKEAEHVGNPSIHPAPLDKRNDEEREATLPDRNFLKSLDRLADRITLILDDFEAEPAGCEDFLGFCVEAGKRASKILAALDTPEPPKPTTDPLLGHYCDCKPEARKQCQEKWCLKNRAVKLAQVGIVEPPKKGGAA